MYYSMQNTLEQFKTEDQHEDMMQLRKLPTGNHKPNIRKKQTNQPVLYTSSRIEPSLVVC